MTETNPEREAREAHIRKLQEDARIERGRAEERTVIDREVERDVQTVRSGINALSRSGVTPDGSGADSGRG
jgi:hypothetical protein